MRAAVRRRTLLSAGAIVALAALGTGSRLLPGATGAVAQSDSDADADAESYVELLKEVHDDYVGGHVVEYEGWVLSQHEFDTIGTRQINGDA
jgi:hypothetical protein